MINGPGFFQYQSPEEPQANSSKIVRLNQDGRSINGEVLLERTSLPDATIRIVTETKGEDNNRSASIRFTYVINAKSFSIKKEVRPEGESQFFERNEYNWKR
jgi:hypothetical protein